tara:strand:- start:171 stop:965 length:795 start_codon:yes stop_codon:yes gene_type:complete
MRRLKKNQPRRSKKLKVKSYKNYSPEAKLIWRIFCYFLTAILLTLKFTNHGWETISNKNIHVIGNNYLESKNIIKASEIDFPKKLLYINPKQIQSNLIRNLSLESVSVNRQIISKKLIINVLEREPVAYAKKIGGNGFEEGMIDQNAIWIPFSVSQEKLGREIKLEVHGWRDDQREWISLIILHQKNLGSPLLKIMLSPNGEINLQTKEFELVLLGSNRNQLKEQIRILSHLSKSLPSIFINQPVSTIDLRDPSKPELQTPKDN